MNNAIQTIKTGMITVSDNYELLISDLSIPKRLEQLISDIQMLNPRKKKIGIKDLQIFVSGHPLDSEVAERITAAILYAEDEQALKLWETCTAELKYGMLLPDEGTINIDLIKKIDIDGLVIRNAYMSKTSITPPEKTPYSYIYGNCTPEDAAALAAILNQIRKMKPEGPMLIREFFEEIDLRILYLFAMNEAEQYASDDSNGGAYLQLAMEANDKIPEELILLSWIQAHVPGTFTELRDTLLDPVWQENRSLFWKGWIRQNRREMNEDYYDRPQSFARGTAGTSIDDESILDDLFNRCENSDE